MITMSRTSVPVEKVEDLISPIGVSSGRCRWIDSDRVIPLLSRLKGSESARKLFDETLEKGGALCVFLGPRLRDYIMLERIKTQSGVQLGAVLFVNGEVIARTPQNKDGSTQASQGVDASTKAHETLDVLLKQLEAFRVVTSTAAE